MELFHLEYNDSCMEYESNMKSIPLSSPDISDIVGAPQLNPRLGDEYQVDIPSMITELERLQLLMNPADSEVVNDKSHSFAMGLPIPLRWVYSEVENGGYGWGYLKDNDGAVNVIKTAEASNVKLNSTSDNGKELGPIIFQPVMTGESKSGQQGKSEAYGMVPGTLSNSWSDADVKSFLLGLFIFGKNFIQIKRFLENKEMGEILSFYYGKFYKSDGHRRWSGCRKIKGRKCMTGQKLFTRWRQHELLTRLISQVPEKFQDTLLQVSKSYEEGRVSLEEYISSLKSTVGLGGLVEAVGIGKDKEDLTSLAAEPGKNNQSFSIYPCAPTGKAWSSLEPSDIIKFLTGGIRLSKAKSNDLFWEAVWPRLLARGWHSEQPNNQGYVSSKDYLVFLIPGVKKFSRRKLVKGDHYFDSVSDVLSKVVSEPNLLELEAEAKVGSCNEEGRWIPENGSNKDDQSDYHRHCYLKPRVSTYNTDHMKFTVVDTSLVQGGKSSDLRKLKSLPLGLKLTSEQTTQMRVKECDSSGNAAGKTEVNTGDKHFGEANHRKGVFNSISEKLTKFTIVDTSMLHRGKVSKVRELRYVPVELKDTSKMTGLSREIDGSSSDDSPVETEANMQLDDKKNSSDVDCHRVTSDGDAINRKEKHDNPDNNADKMIERRGNQKTCSSDDKHIKRTIKHQFSRRARSGHSNHAAPPIKRRRLTACAKAETSRILEISPRDLGSENLVPGQSSSFPEANKNIGHPVNCKQNVCLLASLAVESVEEDNKGSIVVNDCLGMGISCGKVEKWEAQPPNKVPPKSEDGDLMAMVEEDGKCLKPNDPSFTSDAQELVPKPPSTSCDVDSMEQKPDINPRRQSTRNRPLTVRALESMENEFLHVQRRQKKKDVQTPKDPFSPCRRARSRVKTAMHRHSPGGGSAVSIEEKHLNGDSNVNEDISKALD